MCDELDIIRMYMFVYSFVKVESFVPLCKFIRMESILFVFIRWYEARKKGLYMGLLFMVE